MVEAALRKNKGMVARAARMLRCTPQTIRYYMQRHPVIAAVVADERELFVDAAELQLHAPAQRGEAWAVCFALKCLGEERGYVEWQERTAANVQSPNAAVQSDRLIIVGGDKQQYLEGLRQMREVTRATLQSASNDVRPVALPVHGNADNGSGSA
jgi:hypothetical protein